MGLFEHGGQSVQEGWTRKISEAVVQPLPKVLEEVIELGLEEIIRKGYKLKR